MKSTKTILIAALAVGAMLACSSPLRAQDATNAPASGQRPPGGMRGAMSIDRLNKMLNLTDAEKPQVQAALDEMSKKVGELRADASLSQEDRRAKMKEIRDAFSAKMKTILTPEQFAKFEKMGQQRRKAPPADGAGAPPQN